MSSLGTRIGVASTKSLPTLTNTGINSNITFWIIQARPHDHGTTQFSSAPALLHVELYSVIWYLCLVFSGSTQQGARGGRKLVISATHEVAIIAT